MGSEMMMSPPPIPPYPLDLDGMPPHKRKQAKEAFDRQMAQYRAQRQQHEKHINMNFAVLIVISGIFSIFFLGAIFFGAWYEFGITGPIVLIVAGLAFWWLVLEVEKRL